MQPSEWLLVVSICLGVCEVFAVFICLLYACVREGRCNIMALACRRHQTRFDHLMARRTRKVLEERRGQRERGMTDVIDDDLEEQSAQLFRMLASAQERTRGLATTAQHQALLSHAQMLLSRWECISQTAERVHAAHARGADDLALASRAQYVAERECLRQDCTVIYDEVLEILAEDFAIQVEPSCGHIARVFR